MDSFLSIKNTWFNISGRYLQLDGIDYPPKSNIKLIDNFLSYMFSSILVKKHGKVMDEELVQLKVQ